MVATPIAKPPQAQWEQAVRLHKPRTTTADAASRVQAGHRNTHKYMLQLRLFLFLFEMVRCVFGAHWRLMWPRPRSSQRERTLVQFVAVDDGAGRTPKL